MKPLVLDYRSACAALGLALVTTIRAADPAPAAAPAAPPSAAATAGDDTESQLESLVRHAMPGPEHAVLQRLTGSWEAVTRYWMKPGAEPVEARGTSQRKSILGGRFILEELEGGNLALPFRGVALFGYDAFEKKYTSAWADTMNTAILTNLGTYDRTNNVVNFTGQYKDPWTGNRKPQRGILRFLDANRQVLELHVTEPGGQEFKMLEITYTRK